MAKLKPAYLIHGDDHGAVAERRGRLRALAESTLSGAAGLEVLEGETGTPAGLANALCTMSLSLEMGGEDGEETRRVIIVDGVERWREADVERDLTAAMGAIAPGTTVALFAREEARTAAPAALQELVRRAGGQVVTHATVKPWELPGWVREQAAQLGLTLDAAAAKALIAAVGERQQRLVRELEKLALDDEAGTAPGAQEIERRAARSAEWRSFALADALVGADVGETLRIWLRLRQQGERTTGLTYVIAQRLRDALQVSERLQAGEPAAAIKRSLRMPGRAADRLIREVSQRDPQELRAALARVAELELDTRGGAPVLAARGPLAPMSEDTQTLRALQDIAASPAG